MGEVEGPRRLRLRLLMEPPPPEPLQQRQWRQPELQLATMTSSRKPSKCQWQVRVLSTEFLLGSAVKQQKLGRVFSHSEGDQPYLKD